MQTRRWFNTTHPQMLQGAQLLLYINAAFALVYVLTGSYALLPALFAIGGAGAAYGIANDKKWGWTVGIVVSCAAVFFTLLPIVLGTIALDGNSGFSVLFSLMFEVLLVVLLLHTATRGYVKIWFK